MFAHFNGSPGSPTHVRTAIGSTPSPTFDSTDGYTPADLQSAYNVVSSAATLGDGQTVAIVIADDYAAAASDLAVYRSQFGLGPVPNFQRYNQVGVAGSYPTPLPGAGWKTEAALDMDMVSAICPKCGIALVEANSNNFHDLDAAEAAAANLPNVGVISNSFAGGEIEYLNSHGGSYADASFGRTDRIYVAGAGDSCEERSCWYTGPGASGTGVCPASPGDFPGGCGGPPDTPTPSPYPVPTSPPWPASESNVVAVGGTSLVRGGGSRGWTETAWAASGSACSRVVAKPVWQRDFGCRNRAVADVAAVADPANGVAVYSSALPFDYPPGWIMEGGTSVATPIVAAIYALAGHATTLHAARSLYTNASQLNDISGGNNGCSFYLCIGGPGYDGPTGVGSPNGIGAFSSETATSGARDIAIGG
ncbi:MAG TPA: hypothetical protein VIG46_11945, partial [Candidatus Baltobacteraceae bacterium]